MAFEETQFSGIDDARVCYLGKVQVLVQYRYLVPATVLGLALVTPRKIVYNALWIL